MDHHDDEPVPAAPALPGRRWTWAVAVVAVVAVLLPVGWLLSRPAPDAGLSLAEALATPSAPSVTADSSPDPSPPSPTRPAPSPSVSAEPSPAFGAVTVRDASVGALPAPGPAPSRLVVPALGVDVAVDAVGVQDDGSMVVPGRVDRVGWYRYGPVAGAEAGNTVIAGHVDARGQAQTGVMYPVGNAEIGTRVTVVDAAGTPHEYEVVGRETITKAVLPVDDIFARDGEHRLLLITCGGPFQPGLRSYRDNVVVTAVPVTG